jgi:hypothetical protein
VIAHVDASRHSYENSYRTHILQLLFAEGLRVSLCLPVINDTRCLPRVVLHVMLPDTVHMCKRPHACRCFDVKTMGSTEYPLPDDRVRRFRSTRKHSRMGWIMRLLFCSGSAGARAETVHLLEYPSWHDAARMRREMHVDLLPLTKQVHSHLCDGCGTLRVKFDHSAASSSRKASLRCENTCQRNTSRTALRRCVCAKVSRATARRDWWLCV